MIRQLELKKTGRPLRATGRFAGSTLAAVLCVAATLAPRSRAEHREPDLPALCDKLAPPDGNEVVLHVFATGVQIYSWSGTAWSFVGPVATLYADAEREGQVGTHFGTPSGPAWQSNSGSKVVEERVNACTPDPTAIPWLLLRTIADEGPGVLEGVSYVQRLNTVGGIAPAIAGTVVGGQTNVPYTAEYVFYRATAARYVQANLVSDLPGVAQVQDSNLVNPWGLTYGGTGPFWVADNRTGKSTLYTVSNDPTEPETVTKQALEVTIPGGNPTGVVNNNSTAFNGDAFLFASADGTISGWRAALGTTAEVLTTRPGAFYTGLALTRNSGGPLLLAANFSEGTLDGYAPNAPLARFTDSTLPAGYAPFNVQVVGGVVFVMFGKQEAGRGRGLIDAFDPETGAFHRFATGSDAGGNLHEINFPWAVELAPNSFGKHGGDLLVGNFGDGTIMTFGLDGQFHGLLKGSDGRPIAIERLWALRFGNGGRAGSRDTLFFTAGPGAETHGLFGTLKPFAGHDSANK